MESAHDSIKYIEPVYTNSQTADSMANRFDFTGDEDDVMYESTESRYVTELVNVSVGAVSDGAVTVLTNGEPFASMGYIPGYSALYVVDTKNRAKAALAVEVGANRNDKAGTFNYGTYMFGAPVYVKELDRFFKVTAATPVTNGVKFTLEVAEATQGKPEAFAPATTASFGDGVSLAFEGRFDSEKDLTGKYLGEVELQMRDYHFKPRVISLGVTWTQMTELVLDTSFGVSAEEVLMDSAAQEIKKSLDYQAIKYGMAVQAQKAGDNVAKFNAAAGDSIDDSYIHTAQLIGQSIDRVSDLIYNKLGRGGVSALVGGPAAVNYLKLNNGWSDKGAQPKIGAHKVGELNGLPVFKAPASVIGEDTLLTTWKNPAQESDVSIAIGTLVPFYSTGALQRKNFYKEAGIARYEDTQALNPLYLGRIVINNIRAIED